MTAQAIRLINAQDDGIIRDDAAEANIPDGLFTDAGQRHGDSQWAARQQLMIEGDQDSASLCGTRFGDEDVGQEAGLGMFVNKCRVQIIPAGAVRLIRAGIDDRFLGVRGAGDDGIAASGAFRSRSAKLLERMGRRVTASRRASPRREIRYPFLKLIRPPAGRARTCRVRAGADASAA